MSAPATDAIVVIDISTNIMQNIFRAHMKGVYRDISNKDVNYYIFSSFLSIENLTLFNVTTNKLDVSGRSTSNITQDLEVYLSNKLFGSNDLVDLFNNETDIFNDIQSKGNIVTNAIVSFFQSIDAINGTHPNLLVDTFHDNYKYLPSSYTSSNNIGRIILISIDNNDTNRLTTMQPGNIVVSFPFIVGDIVQFILTINVVSTQNNLTNVPTIPARTYLINLRCI